MRILVARLTAKAHMTFLALDENGDTLDSCYSGWDFEFPQMISRIQDIAHRYCIDVIVPVRNDWGVALVSGLCNAKCSEKVWSEEMTHGFVYGWYLSDAFMELIPDLASDSERNEEILRKVAAHIRTPVAQ